MNAERNVSRDIASSESPSSATASAAGREGGDPAGMSAVDRIRRSFDSLTGAEQEAARFILGHLTDVVVCNSAELADLSGVSQPTMSRLYRKLGYANAGEFRRDIRRFHQPGAPETDNMGRSEGNMIDAHLRRDVDSLTRTFARLDETRIGHVARAVLKAGHVGVIGFRNGYPAALHLREQLMQLRSGVRVLPEPGQSVAEEIADYGPDDLVILIGVRRRPAVFARVMGALGKAGVPMVVIGDATVRALPECAGGEAADVTIIETDLSTRVLSSYTAVFGVISLLVDAVADLVDGEGADRIAAINARFRDLDELEG